MEKTKLFNFPRKYLQKIVDIFWFYKFLLSVLVVVAIVLCIVPYLPKNQEPPYIKKVIWVIGSKDTIVGEFQKKENYYLNLKDSSKIYIDKIIYEKDIKK